MKTLMRRFLLCLGLVVLLSLLWVSEEAQAAEFGNRVLRYKDQGTDVVILQHLLKKEGFYKDRIDGIYGRNTRKAVWAFQKANGLKVDGITGPQTYKALPELDKMPTRGKITYDELMFLARVIYAESRGENFEGQVAVGSVILNRVDDDEFPDKIREVIVQEGQFCTLVDGQVNFYPNEKAIKAAKAAIMGYDPTYGALFFYNPGTAPGGNWVASRPVSTQIGAHVFAY